MGFAKAIPHVATKRVFLRGRLTLEMIRVEA
jgi:hypothetical protein